MNVSQLQFRFSFQKVVLLVMVNLFAINTFAAIRYVKESGTGDGSSWANASGDLQAMISASVAGDEIWVAVGTYYPTSGTDRTISFVMRNNLSIYGGFAGNETSLSERNLGVNPTVLSGDIGVAGDVSDNSYSVVRAQNVNSSARLDGFIIAYGNAEGTDLTNSQSNGGGIYMTTASPSLINLIIRQNQSGNDGAGIFALFANSIMQNLVFDSNKAGRLGGGIYSVTASNNTCIHCTFSSNTAVIGGGATGTVGSTTTLVNNIIWGNSSGIYNNVGGVTNVTNSIVQGSFAGAGNLNLDPLFVDAPNGNLEVQSCSPAINRGVFEIDTDVLGRSRGVNGGVDMGAYEFQDEPTLIVASCQGQTIFLNDVGEMEFELSELDNGSNGCGMLTFQVEDKTTITFDCDNLGSNTLTLTITDARGEFAICTTSVTVLDTTSPVIQCFDQTLTVNGESILTLNSEDLVDAQDNCGIGNIALNVTSINCSQIGQIIPITVTVTDVNNNTSTCTSLITVEGLPCGWTQEPDGINCFDGSSIGYNPSTQTWTVTSTNCFSGNPFNSDAMAFAQQTLCGNGSITAQVTGISGTALGWAGVSMRENNSGGAKKAQLMTNLSNFSRREFRTVTGGSSIPQQFLSPNRYWLRLVRSGNQFSMHVSADGVNWFFSGAQNITMSSCIVSGLVVTNYSSNSEVSATFSNVTIVGSGQFLAAEDHISLDQQNLRSSEVTIYPNPAHSEAWIALGDYNGEEVSITIRDVNGKVISHQGTQQEGSSRQRIDLSGMTSGVYIVEIDRAGYKKTVERLVVMGAR
jgi:predicted outer membrane repeat protein